MSCKETGFNYIDYGKTNKMVVGLYLQVEEVENPSLSDKNPKIYYSMNDSVFHTSTGYDACALQFTNMSHYINNIEDKYVYYGQASGKFMNKDVSKITLYAIFYENNEYLIDTKVSETEKVTTTLNYAYRAYYKTDKKQYELQIDLKLN